MEDNVSQEAQTQEAKPSTEEAVKEEEKQQTSTPYIDDANLAAKRMEDANKEKRELLDKEEKLMALKKLGGGSEGGEASQTKEETPAEYAKRVEANDPALTEHERA